MRHPLHQLDYPEKSKKAIGTLDPLIVSAAKKLAEVPVLRGAATG